MILIPAVDVRGGRAVRLVQGDYERETAFDADPADAARRWADEGAELLHVVDLDGAKAGEPRNLEAVRRICAAVGTPVQFGGGLRTAEAIDAAFDAGAQRAVLGTVAITDPALLEASAAERPGQIVASVDARAGKVAVEAWQREAEIGPAELLADLAPRGVSRFLYTPVDVDGTLAGPDLEALGPVARAAAGAGSTVLYSGGVGDLDDLRRLADAGLESVEGIVVGRALYEGRFSVAEGQATLRGG